MPASPVNTRTVYHTAYTHSISLTELEHVPKALICVDKAGVIEWIEKEVGGDGVEGALADHGLRIDDVEMVDIAEGGLVPGLIDTHTVCLLLPKKRVLTRSTHHNTPISELDQHYSYWTGSSN